MKALLLNGSPRQGNTCTALDALKKGMANIKDLEIREIKAAEVNVAPCVACEGCGTEGPCVFNDDTNDVMDAVMEADVIVFASPVYWWGVTAQMKAVIDKLYSRCSKIPELAEKQVGVIIIGEADQEDPQYRLIPEQFECICGYLNWKMAFTKTYTAKNTGDLAANKEAVAELEGLWKNFK